MSIEYCEICGKPIDDISKSEFKLVSGGRTDEHINVSILLGVPLCSACCEAFPSCSGVYKKDLIEVCNPKFYSEKEKANILKELKVFYISLNYTPGITNCDYEDY